jgi:hypothetical protein
VLRGESMINQAPAGRPVSIARRRSPGTDTQQSYLLWQAGSRAVLVRS